MPRTLLLIPLALAALSACAESAGKDSGGVPAQEPARVAAVPSWRANPTAQVTVTGSDPLTVETGPHVVLWPSDAAVLTPPYTIHATLQKHTGRIHEGTGILFGGANLDRPEGEQRYAYFLTRGDGSFLIKLRRGAELPIVQDWTAHPAIRRDGEDGGQANELEVRATTADVAFLVNGTEVARVPASRFDLRGVAGLRVSHELQLEVTGFHVVPGVAGPGAGR